MLRLYRLRHHGRPLYAAERNGHWRLVDGDIFGAFTEGAEIAVDGLAWLPPVTPATFVGVESNYKPVVVGDGDGAPWADEPALFLKPASAVAAPGAAIEIPRGIGRVDAQASVGVVMRKSTRRVLAARAADHILGLVAVNDVVARDVTAMTGQTTRARGFDSFAPVGPCIAVGLDARDLEVRDVRQRPAPPGFPHAPHGLHHPRTGRVRLGDDGARSGGYYFKWKPGRFGPDRARGSGDGPCRRDRRPDEFRCVARRIEP